MDDAIPPAPTASHTAEPAVPQHEELLRQFLAFRDVPCPVCGYNLRDLLGDRCPECGDQLLLRVNTVEPRLAAVTTGLIGLSIGTGFPAIVFVFGLYAVVRGGQVDKAPLTCCAMGAMVGGLLMWLWLSNSRRLRRQGKGRQWGLAAACWCLPIVIVVCLIYLST